MNASPWICSLSWFAWTRTSPPALIVPALIAASVFVCTVITRTEAPIAPTPPATVPAMPLKSVRSLARTWTPPLVVTLALRNAWVPWIVTPLVSAACVGPVVGVLPEIAVPTLPSVSLMWPFVVPALSEPEAPDVPFSAEP